VNFVRLEKHNDWGHDYLSLPGQGLQGQWQTANAKLGLRFANGQVVRVRWPDGTLTQERVVLQEYEATVSDHGHSYSVRGTRPGVETTTHGVVHWTWLADVDVAVEDMVAPATPA
jgi:hypothetical protein